MRSVYPTDSGPCRLTMLHETVSWRTVKRHLPRATPRLMVLRIREIYDRVFFGRYNPEKHIPAYVGPIDFDQSAGWLASWRGLTGVEVGLLGRHFILAWNPPAPGSWFWRRQRGA